MTAEEKAIKWMKSVKDNAVATLDHIKKNELNVSPMLYAGRKEKAETIIKGFEELEQHRAIGTIEECQEAMERRSAKPLRKTEAPLIGENIRQIQYRCPQCDTILIAGVLDKPMIPKEIRNCPICGQKLHWY